MFFEGTIAKAFRLSLWFRLGLIEFSKTLAGGLEVRLGASLLC